MSGGVAVTALALYAGNHGVESQLRSVYRVRGVAFETGQAFTLAKAAAEGFGEICRAHLLIADRDIESIRLSVVADETLVVDAVLFEDVGLAGGAQAKCI